MALSSMRLAVVSGTVLAFVGSALLAGPTRPNSIERFGIGGFCSRSACITGFTSSTLCQTPPPKKTGSNCTTSSSRLMANQSAASITCEPFLPRHSPTTVR